MDFIIGGVAACTSCLFVNPMDVIKTRQQLQGELQKFESNKAQPYRGVLHASVSIVKADGILGLQRGLGPALGFQFVMNSIRLGSFQTVDHLKWTRNAAGEYSPPLCVFWGAIAGIAAATVSSPLYMVKTQIQAQSVGKYAVGYQHSHASGIDALTKIYRKDGLKGLWRGSTAFIPRTGAGSAIQLSTFSKFKTYFANTDLLRHSEVLSVLAASAASGLVTVCGMTPFDVIATRVFNQGVDKSGKGLLYRGFIDCFVKTFKIEGIRGLYKGFGANYWRLAPHTVLNLSFWEQFKRMKRNYFGEPKT